MKAIHKILATIMIVAAVATAFVACNKEKDPVAQQLAEVEAARKPFATFDNTTGQMAYHFDVFEIQQKWNENLASKTIQDRFVIESIQVLDSLPNTSAVLPEVKITMLDTEDETAYTFWLMQNYTEKEVVQNETRYYVENEIRTGVYEFGYHIGNQYYKVNVNGGNCVISEMDSLTCMASGLPRFLLWCRSDDCIKECTKKGTWYYASCNPCKDNQGGRCTEELHPWVEVAGVVIALAGVIALLA